MNIEELKKAIKEENLPTAPFYLYDSRKERLPVRLKMPYSIALNILSDDLYEILYFDCWGYWEADSTQRFSSESEACEEVLYYLRRIKNDPPNMTWKN